MFRKILLMFTIAFILSLGTGEGLAANTRVGESHAESAARQRRFGPYATLRRANEVANYARRRGYKAKVIYAGSYIYNTRSYYVDVW
jgi:hypothetical protein